MKVPFSRRVVRCLDSWMISSCFSSQNTQEVKNERYLISTRQNNVRIFGIRTLPSTKRQTDIKNEMGKTLSSMSLLKIVGDKLPSLVVFEGVFQPNNISDPWNRCCRSCDDRTGCRITFLILILATEPMSCSITETV